MLLNGLSAEQQIQSMTPSVWAYFRSFFYSNTTIRPIDLEGNLTAGKYQCPSQDVVETAQRIMGTEAVQKVFSETLNYNPQEFTQKNEVLKRHNFRLLSSKQIFISIQQPQIVPYYNVCEHDDLDGWIIKSGARRIPEDSMPPSLWDDRCEMALFTQHDSLLRFEMSKRLRQAADKRGIEVIIPNEYAIPYANPNLIDPNGVDVTKGYFVVSEKVDVLSVDETVQVLKENEDLQRQYASSVIALIEETGYSDTSVDNIRLTRDHKIAILDAESAGLLTKRGNELYPKGGSVEKHTRIGLCNLKEIAEQKGLTIVAEQAGQHYQAALKQVSITKITLTVLSCLIPLALLITTVYSPGLLNQALTQNQILAVQISLEVLTPLTPIVLVVISVVKTRRVYSEAKEIIEGDIAFGQRHALSPMQNSQRSQREYALHRKNAVSLRRRFFRHIESVPFANALA